LETVFDAKQGTPEGDLADILSLMIDNYEQKYYSFESPDRNAQQVTILKKYLQ
jgi:HTH-type transcriptional regulator/antitoxin HigA